MAGKNHSIEIGERFIEAMKMVIAKGLVSDTAVFSSKVGLYSQNLSKIKAKERYPTLEAVTNLCIEFGISPSWILLGKGEMMDGQNNDLLKRLEKIEKIVYKKVKA